MMSDSGMYPCGRALPAVEMTAGKAETTPPLSFRALSVISKRSEKSRVAEAGVVSFIGKSLQEISPCGRDDKEVGRDDKEAGRDDGEVKAKMTDSERNLIVPDRAKPEMTPPLSFRSEARNLLMTGLG